MQTSELQLAIDFALYEIPHYALTRLSHPQWNDPLCFILSSCESFFRNASLTFVCWNSVNDPCWWQGICCVDLVRVATSWYFRWSKWFVFIPKHVFEDLGRNCLVADLGLVNVYELAILIKCASLVVLFAHCTWMACCFMEIKSFWRPRCERSHQLKSAAPSFVFYSTPDRCLTSFSRRLSKHAAAVGRLFSINQFAATFGCLVLTLPSFACRWLFCFEFFAFFEEIYFKYVTSAYLHQYKLPDRTTHACLKLCQVSNLLSSFRCSFCWLRNASIRF